MNHVLRDTDADLNSLMDDHVKPALGVIPAALKHQTSSQAVFEALAADFMKPVTSVGGYTSFKARSRTATALPPHCRYGF